MNEDYTPRPKLINEAWVCDNCTNIYRTRYEAWDCCNDESVPYDMEEGE